MIMHSLIDRDFENPEVSNTKIAELVQPDEEIQLEATTKKPDKTEDPEEPPPEMEMVALDLDMNSNVENVAPQFAVNLSISSTGMSAGDGE